MPRGKKPWSKDPTHGMVRKRETPPPRLAPITEEWLRATGQAPVPANSDLAELERICEPGYGRYSVNRDTNGTAYHKWRWSAGPLAGRYVMFVADHSMPLAEGLAGLVEKIDGAETGSVYATLDRYK